MPVSRKRSSPVVVRRKKSAELSDTPGRLSFKRPALKDNTNIREPKEELAVVSFFPCRTRSLFGITVIVRILCTRFTINVSQWLIDVVRFLRRHMVIVSLFPKWSEKHVYYINLTHYWCGWFQRKSGLSMVQGTQRLKRPATLHQTTLCESWKGHQFKRRKSVIKFPTEEEEKRHQVVSCRSDT